MWTLETKTEAAFRAPIGRELHRPDTRVVERAGWYQVVTPSAKGYLNEVYLSQVSEADAEHVIDEVVAEYGALAIPVKWCVGHWTRPTDFRERLLRRGFEARPVRAMACATALHVDLPPGVDAFEIGRGDLETYVDVETRAWGIPADRIGVERASHHAALVAEPRTAHFFGARVGTALVGTCGIFLRGDFGYLVGSQVLPEHRGRGIYRALVAARLDFLRARGIELAVTHARDETSAPMLAHLGFETVYPFECLYSPPSP